MTRNVTPPSFAFDSPAAAVEAMVARLQALSTESVTLRGAFGRCLAQDILTDRPSPACDVSAMDGYAVCMADLHKGQLAVSGENAAGQPPGTFTRGAAMRIFTGAPIPDGADAVIPREQVDEQTDAIVFGPDPIVRPGQHIRRCGENGAKGSVVATAGSLVTPVIASALAAFGADAVQVHRRVRLAVLVTGDEVREAGEPVEPWQLRDSNGSALETMFCRPVWIDWRGREHVKDDPVDLRNALGRYLDEVDALLMTGGVSMGDHDYVPRVLTELGCDQVFHKLPIRPGKPALGAIGLRGQVVLGLPGNPVSVMVTARLLATPVLYRLAGITPPPPLRIALDETDDATLRLHWSRLVRRTGPGFAALIDNKGSGDLIAAACSDGFIQLPPHTSGRGPWPFYPWNLEC